MQTSAFGAWGTWLTPILGVVAIWRTKQYYDVFSEMKKAVICVVTPEELEKLRSQARSNKEKKDG